MVDQTSQFYAILTNVGAAKQANADALGIPWKITQMGVGDANGTDPTPNATQTSLINEWRRAPLNQLKVDDKNSAVIVAEQVIPAEVGGRWIREIALYDTDGDMIAVANCAPTYKPLLSQGSGRTQVVRMNLIVSSASNVQLKIDPAVVLATREWVTEELARQDFKHSVLVATTGPITLSGVQTIDGVALTIGARVLVKNQAAPKDNGLYVVAGGVWARAADASIDAKVTPGLLVLVERGAINGDSAWQLVSDGPLSLGVSAQEYEMAFGRSGVSIGTYRSVTVDKYGRVIAATNPTTVAGYGLTDVYTITQIDSALALKAPLASPIFTGDPRAPTPATADNDSSIATTAFVRNVLARYGLGTDTAFIWTGNIDQIRETGVYTITNGTTGTFPVFTGTGERLLVGMLLHMERDGEKSALQIWETVTGGAGTNPSGLTYKRSRLATGQWSDWAQIWDSLNTPKVESVIDRTPGRMVLSGTYGLGAAIIGSDVNLDNYTVPGNYMTPYVGVINQPPGWETLSRRYSLVVDGAGYKNYLTQTLTSGQTGVAVDAVLQAVRVMSDEGKWSPWRVQAPTDSPVFTGNPSAPTQPRFTSNTVLATTDFVQSRGQQFNGASSFNGSGLVAGTVAHIGGIVHFWGSNAQSYSIPNSAITNVTQGSVIRLQNWSTQPLTVLPQGADRLQESLSIPSSGQVRIISPDSYIDLIYFGDNLWLMYGSGLQHASQQWAKSLGTTGYYRMPNGLIEQWGFRYALLNEATLPIDTVFPIAFSTSCLSLVVSTGIAIDDYDITPSYRASRQEVSHARPTLTGFDGQIFNDNYLQHSRAIYWRALGY